MFKGLASFVQMLLDAVVVILNVVCSAFPPSPFTIIQHTGFGDLIAKINFFLPVYEFLSIIEAWLVAVAIWYMWTTVARWVKAIE